MIRKRGVALLFALACTGHGVARFCPAYPTAARLIVGFTPEARRHQRARACSKLPTPSPTGDRREPPRCSTTSRTSTSAKSAPDGYNAALQQPAVVINMSLFTEPALRSHADFAGVSVISESTNTLWCQRRFRQDR